MREGRISPLLLVSCVKVTCPYVLCEFLDFLQIPLPHSTVQSGELLHFPHVVHTVHYSCWVEGEGRPYM